MPPRSLDYSKWDRIEVSDDEETFHPNLDKNLNIRVNRITRDRKEDQIDSDKKDLEEKGELEKAEALERKRPIHVGNACHVADERTIIQFSGGKSDKTKKGAESFSIDEFQQFKEDHQRILDEFTEADFERSRDMLMQYGHILMDEYANNYYMLNALDEEMKGNRERMLKLCRQGQIISQIFQLAEPMKRPPRDLVPRFFEKFEGPDSRAAFQEGVDHFVMNLQKRAVEKKKEQEQEQEEENDREELSNEDELEKEPVPITEAMYQMTEEQRMGPGGLDPVEVFESLPEDLQQCFKTGDVEMLKRVAASMPIEVFERHFQRCIDSGLWKKG